MKSISKISGGYRIITTDNEGQDKAVYAKDSDVKDMKQWNDVMAAVEKNAPELTTVKCNTYIVDGNMGIKEILG